MCQVVRRGATKATHYARVERNGDAFSSIPPKMKAIIRDVPQGLDSVSPRLHTRGRYLKEVHEPE
jgi:hypothetical protein